MSFITELKEIGYDKLPIEQLVRMQDHVVTVQFIKKMRSRGFNDSSIDELIRLADHGMNN
jgi:archaellum component FlaD/FlaE